MAHSPLSHFYYSDYLDVCIVRVLTKYFRCNALCSCFVVKWTESISYCRLYDLLRAFNDTVLSTVLIGTAGEAVWIIRPYSVDDDTVFMISTGQVNDDSPCSVSALFHRVSRGVPMVKRPCDGGSSQHCFSISQATAFS